MVLGLLLPPGASPCKEITQRSPCTRGNAPGGKRRKLGCRQTQGPEGTVLVCSVPKGHLSARDRSRAGPKRVSPPAWLKLPHSCSPRGVPARTEHSSEEEGPSEMASCDGSSCWPTRIMKALVHRDFPRSLYARAQAHRVAEDVSPAGGQRRASPSRCRSLCLGSQWRD